MEQLKTKLPFSFQYGDKSFSEYEKDICVTRDSNTMTTKYTLKDGLCVTHIARHYERACEWVTYFENTSDTHSQVISHLNDCDMDFDFEPDSKPASSAFCCNQEGTRIFIPTGVNWDQCDFYCSTDEDTSDARQYCIYKGDKRHYTCEGGRSSSAEYGGRNAKGRAPFLDINRKDKGVILAIGWTGKWFAEVERFETCVNFKSGIDGVRFKLMPNEKIRTSSILMFPYTQGQEKAHNDFRKLIRDCFSPVGSPGRIAGGPLCSSLWGGISSNHMIQKIDFMAQNQIGNEYIWIDAGWYGDSTKPCPNEFEGDWSRHTGNWLVNPTYHPDDLKEVSKRIHESGMKLILWFEPERVIKTTPIVQEHPEYFLHADDDRPDVLLNLGNEKALQYIFNVICEKIEALSIDCYRQDFNFDPLSIWRFNDTPDRKGLTEIKHICGLYRLWDKLLEKFPHLFIDNCAGGGKRLDLETIKRSIPLWRSDYQCPANFDPETSQIHTCSYNWWIPYSGTSTGRILNDTYRARSAYGSSMTNNFWFSDAEPWEYDAPSCAWIRSMHDEYKSVRPYYSEDFYNLIPAPMNDCCWCAYQLDRPSDDSGIVMVFRRPNSPNDRASLELKGLKPDKTYILTDADTKEIFEAKGLDILKQGFSVEIPLKRSSKLFRYQAK